MDRSEGIPDAIFASASEQGRESLPSTEESASLSDLDLHFAEITPHFTTSTSTSTLGADGRQTMAQQQQQLQQQRQQQQQQQQQPQQRQQRQPHRDTYKSCDFCARRKRRCDGLLPRCSLCVEKKQAHCHYRQKQPTKSQLKAPAALRQKASSGAKRPVWPGQLGCGGDIVVTPHGRPSGLSSALSLKRCRLSPSPATGLVGMQENAFLNDYFECLGFLPLANESMVRQAVVKIMLGSMPQHQDRLAVGADGLAGGEEGDFLQEGEAGGWGQALARQDSTSCPSKCILWCAVALGALVQGCSLEFVTGYLKLARDSLADCFDGNTIDTARAYLVMAFLYSFLGDKGKSQKHLIFAKSIMERLPPDIVPTDMQNMLLAEGDECRLFREGVDGSGVAVELTAISEGANHAPAATEIMHERDLCNLFLLTDRRLNKAFFEDMKASGVVRNTSTEGEEPLHEGMEEVPEEFLEQGEGGGGKEVAELEIGDVLAPVRSSFLVGEGEKSRVCEDPPPSGSATMTFIKDVLPELERISRLIERSGTCSGVGGLFYHGNVAYMKAVKGDIHSAFESIKFCARLVMRFPGICRYRPHLIHCVLTASAACLCRPVYDPVRAIYNSILPGNGTPAPPLEEWGGMSCICNHIFCRSVQVEIHDVDFTALGGSVSEGGVASSTPSACPSTIHSSPLPEDSSHPPVDVSAYEAQSVKAWAAAVGAGGGGKEAVAAAPPPVFDAAAFYPPAVSPSPPSSAQASPQHMVDVAVGEGNQPDASAAEVIPPAPLGIGRLGGGAGRDHETGAVSTGDGVRTTPALEPRSGREDIGLPDVGLPTIGLPRVLLSGEEEEGRSQTGSKPAVASNDPDVSLGGNSARDDCGVGACGVPDSAHDVAPVAPNREYGVAVVDDVAGCHLGLLGEEGQGVDLRLTDADLMDAADLLMNSDLFDEELGEEAAGCL